MDQPPAEPYPNFSRQAVREGSDKTAGMLLRNLQNMQRVGNAVRKALGCGGALSVHAGVAKGRRSGGAGIARCCSTVVGLMRCTGRHGTAPSAAPVA